MHLRNGFSFSSMFLFASHSRRFASHTFGVPFFSPIRFISVVSVICCERAEVSIMLQRTRNPMRICVAVR